VPGLIRRLWRIVAGAVAVLVILLAVLIGLVRLALVQAPEYRGQVEARAGEVLGWPVELGGMDARLGWRGPEFRFSDARVLTADRERTLVAAASGFMRIDSLALLRGQLRVESVSLAGVALRIEREPAGDWRLFGATGPVLHERGAPRMLERDPGLPSFADLPDTRLTLQDVQLEVEDLRNALGPWLFQVDNLELQIGGGRLSITADGVLPEALGAELALSVVLDGEDEAGRSREWTAGVSFNALDLPALGAALGEPGRFPPQGVLEGSLSAAGDRHRLTRVAGEVMARDLLLPEDPWANVDAEGDAEGGVDAVAAAASDAEAGRGAELKAPEIPYARLATGFEWSRTALGWTVQLSDFTVQYSAGQWASPAIAAVYERDGTARRIEARADVLLLEDLLPGASLLAAEARATALALAPSGTLSAVEFHLDLPGTPDAPPEIYLAGQFSNLSVAPLGRYPGVRNLSGNISGDRYRGVATLDSRDAGMDLPWMFREPLEFDTVAAELEWSRAEDRLSVRVAELDAVNRDGSVTGEAELEIPSEGSPFLVFDAVARGLQLTSGPRYLPVDKLPDTVIEWLDDALRGGQIDEARVQFRGATREFPFRDDQGRFTAEFDIVDGELAFDPDWPNATRIDASVRFENEGLSADVRSARLLDVAAGPVKVEMPDLREGLLLIEGRADGRLAALREFVLASEQLEKILGTGLRPADMRAGSASADIRLRLPLKTISRYRAQVDLLIRDGVVAYDFLGEPLRDVNARIAIDNTRVTGQGITATIAGSPLGADVLVDDEGAVRIEGAGSFDALGLARVLRLPIEAWAVGEGDWSGYLQFPAPGGDGDVRLEISSPLQGLAIRLPEPFRKSPVEARKLLVRASFPGPALIDTAFEWDDSLRVVALVDTSGPKTVLRPVAGGVPGEPGGLVFSGAVRKLDIGEWLALDWPPDLRADRPDRMIAGGKVLLGELAAPMIDVRDVLVELSVGEDAWNFELEAERAAGQVTVPFVLYGDEPVSLHLERLWLGAATDDPLGGPPDPAGPPASISPARVPPLDIKVSDLRYGAIRFGSVTARVLHEGDGIELIGLESVGDGFMFQADGRSRLGEAIDQSHLNLRLNTDDVGATLAFLGFRRTMEARSGLFEAKVDWKGGLRSDWLKAIGGNANLAISNGRLVNVEPGAGRVFGLLSIQALPRRLALDFKDVFGEGTAFDRITGDFRFEGGNAFTDNLVMQGPAANMVLVGRTGLVARDYDQTAVIGADLGRTLPVAGAVVGGPAVGAALFILSEMLRKPFQAQLTYRITGPWENPVIEKVSAGSLAAPPAAPGTQDPPPEAGSENP
jgi:uncharacterized protein (TIGR02099 family)